MDDILAHFSEFRIKVRQKTDLYKDLLKQWKKTVRDVPDGEDFDISRPPEDASGVEYLGFIKKFTGLIGWRVRTSHFNGGKDVTSKNFVFINGSSVDTVASISVKSSG